MGAATQTSRVQISLNNIKIGNIILGCSIIEIFLDYMVIPYIATTSQEPNMDHDRKDI